MPRGPKNVAARVAIRARIPRTMNRVPVNPALAISPTVPHISSVAEELNSRSEASDVQLSYASDKSSDIVVHSSATQLVADMSASPTSDSTVTVIPNISWDCSSTLHASDNIPMDERSKAAIIKARNGPWTPLFCVTWMFVVLTFPPMTESVIETSGAGGAGAGCISLRSEAGVIVLTPKG